MAEDNIDRLGPLMNEIGQELGELVGGDPEGVFLYVEIGENWVGPSVFRNEGEVVRYIDDQEDRLSDLLFDAWYAQPEGKRWSVMEYDIRDGKFSVAFRYPDEVDVEVPDRTRREAALKARFGEKPIVYPPLPEEAFELKP